jgi:copper chaperone CopZ
MLYGKDGLIENAVQKFEEEIANEKKVIDELTAMGYTVEYNTQYAYVQMADGRQIPLEDIRYNKDGPISDAAAKFDEKIKKENEMISKFKNSGYDFTFEYSDRIFL